MKRIAIFLAALVLATPTFAQVIPGAGYVNSSLKSASSSDSQNGFYAGASVEMGVTAVKGLSFVPGAYLSMITSTGTSSGDFWIISGSSKSTFTELAVNVPAYLKYGLELSGGARIFAYAGPTAQIGIISQVKTDTTTSGIISGSSTNTKDYYAGDSGFNRFNLYLGGGLGFGFGKFSINAGYDYGLLNVMRGVDSNANRANLHVGVSYML
jgi:hypothetical protein